MTEVKREVHVAAGIAPTLVKPGEGSVEIHEIFEVPDSPIALPMSAPGEAGAARTKVEPPSAQPISAPEGLGEDRKRFSSLLFLLDCAQEERYPTVGEVFWLIDQDMPGHNMDYVEAQIELQEFGYKDALDIYTLGVEYLATFGALGRNGARFLYAYTEDQIIRPLGLIKTTKSEPSVQEVPAPDVQEVPAPDVREVPAPDTPTETHFNTQATQGDEDRDDGHPIDRVCQAIVSEWLDGVHDCEEVVEKEIEELETEAPSEGATDEGRDTESIGDVASEPRFEESFEV